MHEQGSRWLLVRACLALAAILVVVSCNAGKPASPSGQTAQVPLPADFEIVAYQGQGALGGDTVKLSTLLARGKPVVLNFWAGLCPPCRVEMPDLQEVYSEQKGQVVVVGLDVGPFVNLGSRDAGKALLRQLNVTYPAGTTFDPAVIKAYKIIGMPTTFFIKPNGEIADTWTGLLTRDKLEELTRKLLAASARPA